MAGAVKEGSGWNAIGHVLEHVGAAHYRAGHWNAAVEAQKTAPVVRNRVDPCDWFLLAMAYWQLGSHKEAREWYRKAMKRMGQNEPEDEELRRFRSEASELLGVPATLPQHLGDAEPQTTKGPMVANEASQPTEVHETTGLWKKVLADLGKVGDLTADDWTLCNYRAEDYIVSSGGMRHCCSTTN